MSEELYQNIYRVKSVRLSGWDYSSGDYFITICTKKKIHYFGKIIDSQVELNPCGDIVQQEILDTMKIRKNVVIDTFIVMPNHIHMIVCICRDALHASPLDGKNGATCNVALPPPHRGGENEFGPQKNMFIKTGLSGKFRIFFPNFGCNRGFQSTNQGCQIIIRTDRSFQSIREYIENNPTNRDTDRNNAPL